MAANKEKKGISFQWVYQCAHLIIVQVGLCNAFILGLLGLSDTVDMHQSWVDDLYDGLCAIRSNPACYGLSDPKLFAC